MLNIGADDGKNICKMTMTILPRNKSGVANVIPMATHSDDLPGLRADVIHTDELIKTKKKSKFKDSGARKTVVIGAVAGMSDVAD